MSANSDMKTGGKTTAPKVRKARPTTIEGKENWWLRKKDSKKLDQWKSSKRQGKFKPHFGVESVAKVVNDMKSLADFAQIDMPDGLLRKVEGIVALLLNLQNCTTYQHFTSAIFLYIRDFYEVAITKQVMTYIESLFSEGVFVQQSDALNEPNWLQMVRNLHTNWSLVKGNKAFKQLSKLLSILVTLGLCDVADLTFDMAGFKLFDENIFKQHMSAYDLADALFGTVTYFAEGAYLCFKTGSIQPLLLNDFATMELDDEYTNILAWNDLAKNGNLERVVGMSDAEFSRRLDTLTNNLNALVVNLSGLDKKLVLDKITKCKLLKNDLITRKISSGTRRSPFAVELFGDSNQGKTTFGDQLIDALLVSNGLPVDKQYRAALNPGDKFFSNWTSDKLVAILDDLANEKSNFVEKPPTRAIIDICNNQMYYAPKAELEAKGKCFVEPEVVMVTTNKKDLDAHAYSNCPYSIQRRMDLVMTVKCKEQFQRVVNGKACGVDSRLVREFYTIDGEYCPPAIDDIWQITIERAVKPESLTNTAKYAPVEWNGKKMVDVSSIEAIQYAIECMHAHRQNQMAIMQHMKARSNELAKCTHEGCCHLKGMCPIHRDLDKQFGLQTVVAIENVKNRLFKRTTRDVNSFTDKIEGVITKNLYKKTSEFLDKWDWLCLIPSEYIEHPYLVDFCRWYYQEDLQQEMYVINRQGCFSLLIFAYFSWIGALMLLPLMFAFGKIYYVTKTKDNLVAELKRRNDNLPYVIRNTRDKYAKAICYGSAAIAALYMLSRLYKSYRELHPGQGSLEPTTAEEVKQRDDEPNVWATVCKRALPSTEKMKSTTLEQLKTKVKKNLLYASVTVGDETLMANVFMLTSNVLLIPQHYFEKSDTLMLTCRKVNPNCNGGLFKTRICVSSSYFVPDTDFAVCFTPNGGSFQDLTDYLLPGSVTDHPFALCWRKKDGTVLEAVGRAKALSLIHI